MLKLGIHLTFHLSELTSLSGTHRGTSSHFSQESKIAVAF